MSQVPLFVRLGNITVETWVSLSAAFLCAVAGVGMNSFYDWTGADQSRPAPIVGVIGILIVLVDLALFAFLLRSYFRYRTANPNAPRLNLGIRHLFVATTLASVCVASVKIELPGLLSQVIFLAAVFLLGIWAAGQPELRFRYAILLCCTYLPFLWLVSPEWMSSNLPLPTLIPAITLFIPNLFLSSWAGYHPNGSLWIHGVAAGTAILVSGWLCSIGPRSAAATHLVMATQSIFGSFILNALVRM